MLFSNPDLTARSKRPRVAAKEDASSSAESPSTDAPSTDSPGDGSPGTDAPPSASDSVPDYM